ncbi:MAG: MmcQ/YjbR family DNA-binding protein [Hyphomicrobium sp.]
MKPERQSDWKRLRDLAFGLGLPGIEETTSLKQATLKAHGKLWVWWSPYEDALVFKVPVEEREILIESEPGTLFVTPHYQGHPMVLVRPDKHDLRWARHNLVGVWRAQAPKRLLKEIDAGRAEPSTAPKKPLLRRKPRS